MSDADDVKSKLNIVDVIGEKVTLKKSGRNFKGLCPFHNEKTPSFMVNPDRQSFKCFGCGKGGSVIDFIMEYERLDFPEALEELAGRAGITLTHRPAESRESRLKKELYTVNQAASDYYHYLLISHPLGEQARLYLKQRGLTDKIIRTFTLGYSPNSWESLRSYLIKKKFPEELLVTAGLVVKSSRGGYDRFRGRVMFALRDHKGNVAGFSGRVLNPDAKEAKYINTSETPVYIKGNLLYGLEVTKDAIGKSQEAVIMEGEFDVISSFQAGISNAVAIKGSALTEGHVNLLKRFATKLIFSLDSDLAGDQAARRGIEIAEKAGLDIKVVDNPMGKDPDEAVRENVSAFKKAVEQAIPVYDFYIKSALSRFNPAEAFGKKQISNELFPFLSTIDNPVVQAHYVKKLANILDVPEEAVADGVRRAVRTRAGFHHGFSADQPATSVAAQLSREERLELYILALILQGKTVDYLAEIKEEVTFADFTHPAVYRILQALDFFIKPLPAEPFNLKKFTDGLAGELLPVLDTALMWDLGGIVDDEELLAREWHKAVRELRRSILRKKIKNLTTILDAEDMNADPEGYLKTQEALAKLTNDLRALEKSVTT
jgi:DNA primase